jgi:hypothetical protein
VSYFTHRSRGEVEGTVGHLSQVPELFPKKLLAPRHSPATAVPRCSGRDPAQPTTPKKWGTGGCLHIRRQIARHGDGGDTALIPQAHPAAAARAAPRESGGSARDALAAAPRTAARLVAGGAPAPPAAAGRLVISRPQPGRGAVFRHPPAGAAALRLSGGPLPVPLETT